MSTNNNSLPPNKRKSAPKSQNESLESYFAPFRQQVIGQDYTIETHFGSKPLLYADWTASGRLYAPIENKLSQVFGPLVGNTHTETNITGTSMTLAYHKAQTIIKKHVNADLDKDVLLLVGSGMTGAINKFQRILGIKLHENHKPYTKIPDRLRPIVFVTHREHHSNEISWRETIADVEYIPFGEDGKADLEAFNLLLEKYQDRKLKIAAISACSNVTGIQTPFHQIARLMHENGGLCFVDFAASAPYVHINMHPDDPDEKLDAIYFSMHKFLGGPATPGVLLFDKYLYCNNIPDEPGGGTVKWVNRWYEQSYFDRYTTKGIEAREDGGTPAFLQTIKAALCVQLKEKMGIDKLLKREEELVEKALHRLKNIEGITVLEAENADRLGIFSFYMNDYVLDYNLAVKLLNDHFGVQVRGGCACAGPYGHCLLNIQREVSKNITDDIDHDDFSSKPGWIRLSLHPVMSDAEADYALDAIEKMVQNFGVWKKDYAKIPRTNEWRLKRINEHRQQCKKIDKWFEF